MMIAAIKPLAQVDAECICEFCMGALSPGFARHFTAQRPAISSLATLNPKTLNPKPWKSGQSNLAGTGYETAKVQLAWPGLPRVGLRGTRNSSMPPSSAALRDPKNTLGGPPTL